MTFVWLQVTWSKMTMGWNDCDSNRYTAKWVQFGLFLSPISVNFQHNFETKPLNFQQPQSTLVCTHLEWAIFFFRQISLLILNDWSCTTYMVGRYCFFLHKHLTSLLYPQSNSRMNLRPVFLSPFWFFWFINNGKKLLPFHFLVCWEKGVSNIYCFY